MSQKKKLAVAVKAQKIFRLVNENNLSSITSLDDQNKDEFTILPLWFGDPQRDVLTAEDWIGSVERAKDMSHWNDEVTMSNVVNALFGPSLVWFLDLVTKPFHRQCVSMHIRDFNLILVTEVS